ncbi:DUF1073 domain-containing protein [Buttiauxella sp. B2]|uniref:DUF1073 domain-containing protein n=1 Tax=Buttiauxella sp. B2 TaxID=2587812 RepID=UPI00112423FB|nr:DUF1073 domain-containing protein [Buttiauxella sp. B2]TNV22839.1 DUF1073 domain-containing protein [Buttiauxella sp. B2]
MTDKYGGKPRVKMMNDGSIVPTFDGLANVITGLGTDRDRRSYNRFSLSSFNNFNNYFEMEAAYLENWIARAVVDHPVEDATREWRRFTGGKAEAISDAEKRYELQEKTQEAFTWAGVYGGAGVLMMTDQDPAKPLERDKIKKGSLKNLVVLDRTLISPSTYNLNDPLKENYMRAESFRVNAGTQEIHHSHFVMASGAALPMRLRGMNAGWDDSILRRSLEDIKDSAAAKGGIASLIGEANIDVISRDNLGTDLSSGDMDEEITTRFLNFGMMKSLFRLALLDSKETYERKQISFGGLGEILAVLMEWTAGAARQPMTRLFGVQSKGLGDSGEGDSKNYYNRIRGEQESKYRKFFSPLDEVIIRSALGDLPDDVKFEFNPLALPTEAEVSDRNLAEAQTDELRIQQKVVPRSVVSKKLKEGGQYAIDDKFITQLEQDEQAERDGDFHFSLGEAETTVAGDVKVPPTAPAGGTE